MPEQLRSWDGLLLRTALVTGAAKRIGRALAMRLADEGFAVAIHYRHSFEEAQSLLAAIKAKGGQGCLVQGDLSRKDIAENLIQQAQDALGTLGVLVNNAAIFERDTVETLTPESLDKHLVPNFETPLFLAKAFAKQLPSDKKGFILNLLDQSVLNFPADFTSYTLSKSALWSLTRMLALALAPKIRVNAIAPGPVIIGERQKEAHFEKLWRSTPLSLHATKEEIAEGMMSFLHLPSVTGQLLVLDGGQHLQK